ncbi:hypothetical protein GCM10007216_06570 [Thalassobacillus devorans]|uniref:DUF2332 domain-containing protein n=1 Tax=Thalassobacillus devorans TaxID=279813 RepID=A0ABQ1NKI2_9BACI|nr:DUF2332 domain-containing protein [Thalassobacillus devorans]NIK27568.1 hypothetical protein [Thalassobacillus devorans]GGC78762.1 hypothetical protein GCM10007216_06570 [Thalassobacillus devorans]
MKHLAGNFIDFSELECKGSSPLYEQLALKVADNEELLELSSHAREGQPIPNLLFGAVHYLLLSGEQHELRKYYPSLTEKAEAPDKVFPHFLNFCRTHRRLIMELIGKKLVQTNEVRRCAYLYPVFCYIHKKTKNPLSLIEIGTSAGLQLLWDQYGYTYGDNLIYGNKSSVLQLSSQVRQGSMPGLLSAAPPVASRTGVDLHVSDLTDGEETLWLKALIWPEHKERRENFEKAVSQFRENPPSLVEGDGVLLLEELAANATSASTLCIFHTHVANQMSREVKEELLQKVTAIGRERDVFHIYNNIEDRKLHLDYFINGKSFAETVGETDGHGRWFDWHLNNTSCLA